MGISELGLILIIIVAMLLIGLILKPSADDPWSEKTLTKELAKRLGVDESQVTQMSETKIHSEFSSANRKWEKLSPSRFNATLIINWKSGEVTKVATELQRSELPSKAREHFLRTKDNVCEISFEPNFLKRKV